MKDGNRVIGNTPNNWPWYDDLDAIFGSTLKTTEILGAVDAGIAVDEVAVLGDSETQKYYADELARTEDKGFFDLISEVLELEVEPATLPCGASPEIVTRGESLSDNPLGMRSHSI